MPMQDFTCRFFDESGMKRDERVLSSGMLEHATASARCTARLLRASIFEVWQQSEKLHQEQIRDPWSGHSG